MDLKVPSLEEAPAPAPAAISRSSSSSGSSSSVPVGVIIGGAVGGAVLLAAVGLVYWRLRKRRGSGGSGGANGSSATPSHAAAKADSSAGKGWATACSAKGQPETLDSARDRPRR